MSTPVLMEMLSKRYGWTPAEIRSQSYSDILQYIEVIGEIHKIEKWQAMKAKNRK